MFETAQYGTLRTLRQEIREYVKQADYRDYDDLAAQIEKIISKSDTFRAEAVRECARSFAREYGGREPRKLSTANAENGARLHAIGLREIGKRNCQRLMDTRLGWSNGKRLGDANREEVLKEAHGHHVQRLAASVKWKWYTDIAMKMYSTDQVVQECMDEDTLAGLLWDAQTQVGIDGQASTRKSFQQSR